MDTLPQKEKWPCLFTESDTTGEKDFEEFFVEGETLDLERFKNLGIVKSDLGFDNEKLELFMNTVLSMRINLSWKKSDLVELFHELLPGFYHKEKGKYLDSKM